MIKYRCAKTFISVSLVFLFVAGGTFLIVQTAAENPCAAEIAEKRAADDHKSEVTNSLVGAYARLAIYIAGCLAIKVPPNPGVLATMNAEIAYFSVFATAYTQLWVKTTGSCLSRT